MVGAMVKQLMKRTSLEEIQKEGMANYYVDLTENLATQQKARATYEYLINLVPF